MTELKQHFEWDLRQVEWDLDDLLKKPLSRLRNGSIFFLKRLGDHLFVEGQNISHIVEARREFDQAEDGLNFACLKTIDVVHENYNALASLPQNFLCLVFEFFERLDCQFPHQLFRCVPSIWNEAKDFFQFVREGLRALQLFSQLLDQQREEALQQLLLIPKPPRVEIHSDHSIVVLQLLLNERQDRGLAVAPGAVDSDGDAARIG